MLSSRAVITALSATALAVCILTAQASAMGGFDSEVLAPASNGLDKRDPVLALDAQGSPTVAWSEIKPNDYEVVKVATRSGSSTWKTTELAKFPEGNDHAQPVVAVTSAGIATVVWRQNLGSSLNPHFAIYSSTRVAGSWSAGKDISRDQGGNNSRQNPQVVSDRHGGFVAVWQYSEPGNSSRVETVSGKDDGQWSMPQDLDVQPVISGLELASNSDGDVTALWSERHTIGASTVYSVRSSTRSAGQWLQKPQDIRVSGANLVAGSELNSPALAGQLPGTFIASWLHFDTSTGNYVVEYATRASGKWGAAYEASDPNLNARDPRAAVGSWGEAVLVWVTTDPNTAIETVQSITRSYMQSGGQWSYQWSKSVTDLSDSRTDALFPQPVVDSNGNITVAWVDNDDDRIKSRYHSRVGGWWGIRDGSPVGEMADPPQVAIADNGDIAAAWSADTGPGAVVRFGSYYTYDDGSSGSWPGGQQTGGNATDATTRTTSSSTSAKPSSTNGQASSGAVKSTIKITSRRRLKLSGGRTAISLNCLTAIGSRCQGTLVVTLGKKKLLSQTYDVTAGNVQVKLKLTKKATVALKRAKRRKLLITAKGSDNTATAKLVVRFAKAHKHRSACKGSAPAMAC